jgi:hypothetical protein
MRMQQIKIANFILLKQLNTKNPLEMNSIELRPVFCDGFSHPGFFQACPTCRPSMACKRRASLNLLRSLNKKLQMPSASRRHAIARKKLRFGYKFIDDEKNEACVTRGREICPERPRAS